MTFDSLSRLGSGSNVRIEPLDLLRGMAVLGILAVNIAGFAGPPASTETPSLAYGGLPGGGGVNEAVFAGVFLIFEGKMRGIFAMLFGASMLLFVERAEAAGRNGTALQLRRLGWLALFGYLHFLLLWWGDILFTYALCGALALPMRRVPPAGLAILGLAIFALWHGMMALGHLPLALAEEHVRLGIASATERREVGAALNALEASVASDGARDHLGFGAAVMRWWADAPLFPLEVFLLTVGEVLALMLIGMALYRSGFFINAWPRARLRNTAFAGIGLGGAHALALLGCAWPRHFPALAMPDVMAYWAGPEHLAMALGYMAAVMLAAPRLLKTRAGRRLAAAGRMAFSNYLGTSLVMAFVFYGWGLGLEGHLTRLEQLGFLLAGWALMLAWSAPWLAQYRHGPLEWAWRSLTAWRVMPMRRPQAPQS